jgi:hypothetical protein
MLVQQLFGGLNSYFARAWELVVIECCAAQLFTRLGTGVIGGGKRCSGHAGLQGLPETVDWQAVPILGLSSLQNL